MSEKLQDHLDNIRWLVGAEPDETTFDAVKRVMDEATETIRGARQAIGAGVTEHLEEAIARLVKERDRLLAGTAHTLATAAQAIHAVDPTIEVTITDTSVVVVQE